MNSFKYFLPYKTIFFLVDIITGALKYDGVIILRLCISTSKPDTIIDVRDLEMELEAITLHSGCNNYINKIISKMLTVYQEIHSKTGKHSYTPRRLITNLFRATLSCPVEKYEAFVDQLKQRWIMEEITYEYNITKKML